MTRQEEGGENIEYIYGRRSKDPRRELEWKGLEQRGIPPRSSPRHVQSAEFEQLRSEFLLGFL